jgi:hypothetical protein
MVEVLDLAIEAKPVEPRKGSKRSGARKLKAQSAKRKRKSSKLVAGSSKFKGQKVKAKKK